MNNLNFDLENTTDEDFFGSLKGKKNKLQQLFDADSKSQDENQQSLKYQRPKVIDLKLSSSDDTTDTGSGSSQNCYTLMAKIVQAFKQGALLGQAGLALTQNPNDSCGLIIYKKANDILASTTLVQDRNVLFRYAKYWQFYDKDSIYWSFSFDRQQDEEEFKDKLSNKNITVEEIKEDASEKQISLEENEVLDQVLANVVKNINENSDFIANDSKSSLIKRIAKMGKPLPTLSNTKNECAAELSDSSDTEVLNTPLSLSQKPSIGSRGSKIFTNKSNQQLVPTTVNYSPATPANTTAVYPTAINYSPATSANATAVYPANTMESQYMNMLLAEQRTQGTELRINMNKLENKVEKVLDKLELLQRHEGKVKGNKDDEILELEEKILMLKKENRKLKQAIAEPTHTDSEESIIKETLKEFYNDFEDRNIVHNNDLKTVLKALIDKLKFCQDEFKENQKQFSDNVTQLRELQLRFEEECEKNKNYEEQIDLLKEQEVLLHIQLKQNELLLNQYDKEINELKLKQEQSSENLMDLLVKSIMNNLYTDIADKLDNSNIPNTDNILSLIALSIRQQTLNSLQDSTA